MYFDIANEFQIPITIPYMFLKDLIQIYKVDFFNTKELI